MKGVIWILACGVGLVGCQSRPLDTVESPEGGVSRELATAVQQALDAKRLEENGLVQYGVEKQRLVSALMPLETEVDWANAHAMAIERYASERDAEAERLYRISGANVTHHEQQGVELFVVIERLQDEHRQSQLAASNSEREIASLKTQLAQERDRAVRLVRESQKPAVSEAIVHVDQTPRPMAPYGHWASPSGYRYGGRW